MEEAVQSLRGHAAFTPVKARKCKTGLKKLVDDLAPVSRGDLIKVLDKCVAAVLKTKFEEMLTTSKVVKSWILEITCVLREERRAEVEELKSRIDELESIVKNMESAPSKACYKKPRRAE